ncbi:unnamed protein product, partial [Iphiclides podalirius]
MRMPQTDLPPHRAVARLELSSDSRGRRRPNIAARLGMWASCQVRYKIALAAKRLGSAIRHLNTIREMRATRRRAPTSRAE